MRRRLSVFTPLRFHACVYWCVLCSSSHTFNWRWEIERSLRCSVPVLLVMIRAVMQIISHIIRSLPLHNVEGRQRTAHQRAAEHTADRLTNVDCPVLKVIHSCHRVLRRHRQRLIMHRVLGLHGLFSLKKTLSFSRRVSLYNTRKQSLTQSLTLSSHHAQTPSNHTQAQKTREQTQKV